MTRTFTIALFACALSSIAMSAQQNSNPTDQKDQKEKTGSLSQPADPQPVIMPAGQRPEEWKFGKEREAEAKQAVDDKKAAKKKAEEDRKAATEARKKAEAEKKLAAKAAKEEAEKQRIDERRAAAEQKKATEQQRAAEARSARETAAARKAEGQQAADERRTLERRAEAEKAADDVRAQEARVAAAAKRADEQRAAEDARAAAKQSAAQKSASASSPAPAAQKPAGDAKASGDGKAAADGKSSVDPMRPPAVVPADQRPDAWKMQNEKPRAAEGSAASQTQKGGQTKPGASAPPKPRQPWRGWSDRALISLNGGWQSSSFELRDTREFDPPAPGDRERRTLNADYSVESGMSFDFGGGVRVWRALAAGVSVTRFKDSRDVPVSGTVPHPFFFNRARPVDGVTAGARQETAVHVDAMWVVPIRRNMTLALFGGPSFYSVKQTVVSDFDYNQSYPYDDATLTNVIATDESSSVTGINVGVDVGYYFTDTIGVGGLIRFGRASVDTSIGSLDVGGPEFGVGVRIRIPQGRPRGRATTTR